MQNLACLIPSIRSSHPRNDERDQIAHPDQHEQQVDEDGDLRAGRETWLRVGRAVGPTLVRGPHDTGQRRPGSLIGAAGGSLLEFTLRNRRRPERLRLQRLWPFLWLRRQADRGAGYQLLDLPLRRLLLGPLRLLAPLLPLLLLRQWLLLPPLLLRQWLLLPPLLHVRVPSRPSSSGGRIGGSNPPERRFCGV